MSKYIGAGVPCDLLKKSPTLGSRLWLELDIVPISIEPEAKKGKKETCFWNVKFVDEQADSMARKCIFTPQGGGVALMRHALIRLARQLGVDLKCHPIPEFVPSNVPNAKVAYLPATTDWNLYNQQCHTVGMTELKWPSKKYIIQIARFDPAKGIPDAIAAFGEFCHLLSKHHPTIEVPQLIICGNGSVDDPDGTKVYSQTMNNLKTNFPSLLPSVSVMRLTPNDQLLNTLLSSSHVALQLSNREGFEVKVSEAIHKGIPVIATKSGGIPLQVQHGKNGLLVEAGDSKAVAGYLLQLWTDGEMYGRMSGYARGSVSDEVGTVGNALAWFYLVDQWGNGDGVVPGGRFNVV
ncbi:putative Trehalose phosphorylase [Glarea lozoyensis 74030]|uniref:Putative Trehalose phosphorylase n=1 Tax=Glarea lozoyensis (strain ATCC 74030 / MF5533) TaxID=1104152 RepID=H0EKH8_GLAL7|nr:putative Trehalose phosphorylase [Glarea lozoyensis 74030]